MEHRENQNPLLYAHCSMLFAFSNLQTSLVIFLNRSNLQIATAQRGDGLDKSSGTGNGRSVWEIINQGGPPNQIGVGGRSSAGSGIDDQVDFLILDVV